MTLNQLKVFVLVVRLGSFRAAAEALGVSEPAVSQAIAALRKSLGDELLTKEANAVSLTAAGRRIVGMASQMVNLAVEAEAAVRQAQGGPALLNVVAGATPGAEVVPALLSTFTHRVPQVEVELGIATSDEMEALLVERLADVAIGPRLARSGLSEVVSEPLMKFRMVLTAKAESEVMAGGVRDLTRMSGVPWLVDPSGADPASEFGQLVERAGVAEERVSVYPTQRAAWAAAAGGAGVAPAIEHLLRRERPAGLGIVPIAGLPADGMWYVNTLTSDRRSEPTSRFVRFLSKPEATQAMFRADGRVPASKFKPPVYVTIWS